MWKGRSHQELAGLFAEAFPGEGELIDLAEGDSPLRREAAISRRIAALYWPPEFAGSCGFDFECVVYDSYAANAFAAFASGIHWIALSTGMLYTLAELAVRVAAAFPIPGDIEPRVVLTGAEGAGFRYDPADFRGSVDDASAFFRQALQFGKTRSRLLNTLWLDSQTLVWRHELFHASLGHTRYLQMAFGVKALSEYPRPAGPRVPPDQNATRRALEFHADWAAFGSILKLAQSDFDPSGSDLRKLLGLEWRAASWMAAILLLPAFVRGAELRGAPKSLTHPSAAARFSIFLTRILELPDETVREKWIRGTGIALRAFRAMGEVHTDFGGFAELISDDALEEGSAERVACIDDFDPLQDALIPYAVLPLGHPHQGNIEPLPRDEAEGTGSSD